ncbi:uncharacterized protein LOC131803464 [Musca domestica]|uniref:Uncharacterized protein LOC131803464 n=1 Tax=Musca domestica TaxID=7370 RepID=A0ABM3V4U6_MUSDO|nr:uncharacterized protein LOC131803464 [Musca domestica]
MKKEFQNQKFQEEDRENATASGGIELEKPGILTATMLQQFRAFQKVVLQQQQEQMMSIMEDIEQMFLMQRSSKIKKTRNKRKDSLLRSKYCEIVPAGKSSFRGTERRTRIRPEQ